MWEIELWCSGCTAIVELHWDGHSPGEICCGLCNCVLLSFYKGDEAN